MPCATDCTVPVARGESLILTAFPDAGSYLPELRGLHPAGREPARLQLHGRGGNLGAGDPDATEPHLPHLAPLQPLRPGPQGGQRLADAECADLAREAGLKGTYRAWVVYGAYPRPEGFDKARGWIRTDGVPFADSLTDLARTFYPPRCDERAAATAPPRR